MSNIRVAFPLPSLDVLEVDSSGTVTGEMAEGLRTIMLYFYKFNITNLPSSKKLATSDETILESRNMLYRGEVDVSFSLILGMEYLAKNITHGPVFFEGWCQLVTSPALKSSILTDGPESALIRMRIDLLLLMTIFLSFMLYLAKSVYEFKNEANPVWFLYVNLIKQSISSVNYEQLPLTWIVFSVSIFLIQLLFGSFLNTERTSISSFIRIHSFEDALKHNMTILVPNFSVCPWMSRGQDLKIVNVYRARLTGEDFSWCAGTDKCAMLVSNLDINIILPSLCAIDETVSWVINNPPYYSPKLIKSLGGWMHSLGYNDDGS